MNKKINVCFLIGTLNVGGAERQFVELVRHLNREQFAITVIVFRNEGPLRDDVRACDDVRFLSLNQHKRWDLLRPATKLHQLLKREDPKIIHAFLPGANFFAFGVGSLLGKRRVVWSIRASYLDLSAYSWPMRLLVPLNARLSNGVDCIVYNSQAGQKYYEAHGYAGRRVLIIPNGIDTECFSPQSQIRELEKQKLGLSNDTPVIGMVGRIDRNKDHHTFLEAASILHKTMPVTRFLLIGEGDEKLLQQLRKKMVALRLDRVVYWLGFRNDIPRLLSSLDVHTSTSIGEGFPNAVAEAMACGVPCVVTDVGDSADIVGDTGFVVPSRNPQVLANAWRNLLQMSFDERCRLGEKARNRIIDNFSLEKVIPMYEELYQELCAG